METKALPQLFGADSPKLNKQNKDNPKPQRKRKMENNTSVQTEKKQTTQKTKCHEKM